VVDSMDDPAVPGLRTLVKEVKSLGTHDVRLQLAESATTCSQKIANQLVRLSSSLPPVVGLRRTGGGRSASELDVSRAGRETHC